MGAPVDQRRQRALGRGGKRDHSCCSTSVSQWGMLMAWADHPRLATCALVMQIQRGQAHRTGASVEEPSWT
jgi:hypothetical protein